MKHLAALFRSDLLKLEKINEQHRGEMSGKSTGVFKRYLALAINLFLFISFTLFNA